MARHVFLSPEWVEAARALRAELEPEADTPALAVSIRLNVVVTDVPFADEPAHGHVDTRGGLLTIDHGHLDDEDVTITLDHELARSLFVDRDLQAIIQALLKGRISAVGDVMKLLALQPPPGAQHDPRLVETYRRLRDLTE